MDFAVRANHRVKKKESEKVDKDMKVTVRKYMGLARELRKLWNMKVMVVPIVNKDFVKRLEDLENRGRVETI